jgi:hypothetical protein
MLTLHAVRADGFTIEPLIDAAIPTIKISGNGDTESIASLDRFLRELHEQMLHAQSDQIEVDFGDLYFMNSSCIKALMSWIHRVRLAGAPYRVYFMTNPRLSWQRRSLQPLQRLAPTIVALQDKWGL